MMLRALLLALRQQCLAMIAVLDTALAEMEPKPAAPTDCPHPEDQRRAAPRMGAPHAFICTACGTTVTGVTDAPAQEG